MPEVYVNRITSALGEEARDVEETAACNKMVSSCDVIRQAGFARHHVCSEATTAYDLARRAVAELGAEIDGTGAIVYSTCIPANANLGASDAFARSGDVKHLMDFPASHLQADFGLDGASVIGLTQQACTSLLGSIRVARALLVSEPELRKVLCVTADRFPNGALYEQAYNLISDGAAACVVSGERRGFRVVAWHAITNGALAQASDDETVGAYFSYIHKIIIETVAKAGLTLPEIAWVVPQNTNVSAWKILARLLPFDPERIFLGSIAEIGHIISSDNLVNLRLMDDAGLIHAGERLLLVMAGFGLNWQALILEKV